MVEFYDEVSNFFQDGKVKSNNFFILFPCSLNVIHAQLMQ